MGRRWFLVLAGAFLALTAVLFLTLPEDQAWWTAAAAGAAGGMLGVYMLGGNGGRKESDSDGPHSDGSA